MKKWIESSDRGRGGGEPCRQRKKGRRRSDGVHARETKNFGMVPRGGGLEARRLWRRFSRRTSSWPGLVVEWVSAVSTVANELI